MTTTVLRLDAPPYELAALRETLLAIVRERPATFDALFAPNTVHAPTPVPPEVEFMLRAFGLVEGTGAVIGRLPIRRRGDRFYVMALGGVGEYRQDVWPETDAMLAQLEGASAGRVLDMGTGCGIVAIEAVARGHTVIATDLYPNTLALARFNAALNGFPEGVESRLELRQGHLFEPVRGETFDLVLTAPHYTRVADQLRLEAVRAAADVIAPRGRAVIATFCEWTDGEPLAMASTILAMHARAGFDVTVTPMPAAVKQQWFTVAASDAPLAGLTSRHRFLVEITRATGDASVAVTMPAEDVIVRQHYAPLHAITATPAPAARAVRSRSLAVIRDRRDLDRLEELVAAVRGGVVTLDGAIPSGLLDACRFGALTCVPAEITRGAAGAILDGAGGVRPCTHGDVIARAETSYAELVATLHEHAAAAAERRGCASCAASAVCSRCLSPHVLDEAAYCATIRRWADAVPRLQRLLSTLTILDAARAGTTPPLRIKLGRSVALVAARGRARSEGIVASPALERAIETVAGWWHARHTAIAVDAERRCSLFWWEGTHVRASSVHPEVAAIGELIADGATAAELLAYVRAEMLPPDALVQALEAIRAQFARAHT